MDWSARPVPVPVSVPVPLHDDGPAVAVPGSELTAPQGRMGSGRNDSAAGAAGRGLVPVPDNDRGRVLTLTWGPHIPLALALAPLQ